MHCVYVLLSLKDFRLYIGVTGNINERFANHNSGKVVATKNRRPFKLIYCEHYAELSDAKRQEIYLKGGKGHNDLKIQIQSALIKNNYKFID